MECVKNTLLRKKNPATDAITIKPSENSYQPYLQFGGTRFFHLPQSNTAGTVDLFVPIWQQDLTDLIFTDVRITDRSGTPFEGNIHLGYRHLFSESQQSLGFYGAFDRKKTAYNNYFNQITVGGEYWIQNWFIGANYYQPIGGKTKELSPILSENTAPTGTYTTTWVTKNFRNEKAMAGTDAEIGYEFIEGLVGYAGGYYFGGSDVPTVSGPRARLTYDLSLKNNGRVLGIFDKVGLETGVQHDKPRGTVWYLSANVRVGWLPDKKSALEGVSHHMVDPVRRDIDVVSGEVTSKQEKRSYASIDVSMGDQASFGAVDRAIEDGVNVIVLNGKVTKAIAEKIMEVYGKKRSENQIRKMPAIIVNGEVYGFKDVVEKFKSDLVMKEAISKFRTHFSNGTIDDSTTHKYLSDLYNVEESKPEVKAEEKKPEVRAEETKPEAKAEEKKPEVRAEETKPEAKEEEEKKPEVKAEEKKPELGIWDTLTLDMTSWTREQAMEGMEYLNECDMAYDPTCYEHLCHFASNCNQEEDLPAVTAKECMDYTNLVAQYLQEVV